MSIAFLYFTDLFSGNFFKNKFIKCVFSKQIYAMFKIFNDTKKPFFFAPCFFLLKKMFFFLIDMFIKKIYIIKFT